jgi:hypothetical protein
MAVKEVGEKVADLRGNTPKAVLSTSIAPEVFAA